ncbi:hypothetical protein LTR28_012720 [Elasticomyces elasticus]|nr:hypothetical protein LTR28_012720 [Elasticomyces elasticus]
MEQFERSFRHLPENGVIVCKSCRFAVIPSRVEGHLQGQHPIVSAKQRRELAAVAGALTDLAQSPDQIRHPDPGGQPIEGLPVFRDGLRCIETTPVRPCNYICREARGMKKHCRERHGWQNPRKRGGAAKKQAQGQTGRSWVDSQICQRFPKTGKWQRYLLVQMERQRVSSQQNDTQYGESATQRGKTFLQPLSRDFAEA